MIPLRAENPRRTFPAITILLIGLNFAAFAYQLSLPSRTEAAMVTTYGVVPARAERLVKNPQRYAEAALLPLFTSMFLHGGWLHILGNMLFLWVFGGSVEDRLGHGAYLAFYLFCGVASGMTHVL